MRSVKNRNFFLIIKRVTKRVAKMGKTKKTRKPYDTRLDKSKVTKNDRLLGKFKIILLLATVSGVAIAVISRINS